MEVADGGNKAIAMPVALAVAGKRRGNGSGNSNGNRRSNKAIAIAVTSAVAGNGSGIGCGMHGRGSIFGCSNGIDKGNGNCNSNMSCISSGWLWK